MNNNFCIAISRQFGSGGRNIGKALADKLSLDFYDRELISLAAKENNLDQQISEESDEKATNSLLYSLSMGLYSFGNSFSAMGDLPVNDTLYLLQHKIIKNLAQNGRCVIVGRCADLILRDNPNCISIFIHANFEYRKNRAIEVYHIDKSRAGKIVKQTDKARANYYSFYSGQKWGLAENYDLCLDSSKLEHEQIIDLIIQYANLRTCI